MPTADVGGVHAGDFLYSVVGFSSTLAGPTVPVTPSAFSPRSDFSPPGNLIDATPAFTAHLGSTTSAPPSVTPASPDFAALRSGPNTAAARPVPFLGALALLLGALVYGLASVPSLKRRDRNR